eukprot:GHVN01065218.1.p1 GENE.GHVN01065218.1~~GHVN01065218.1.p1  ORF type:complete len:114 (-),score=20.24 GHVN01065218.1:447-788(-)
MNAPHGVQQDTQQQMDVSAISPVISQPERYAISASSLPPPMSSTTDPSLASILAAITSLESRLTDQHPATQNDLNHFRLTIDSRLDALDTSCSKNYTAVRDIREYTTKRLLIC